MNSTTTSGIGGSGECSGPDVTAIETVTVCIIDRRKGVDQTPQCSVKRVRVFPILPAKADTNPTEMKESPTPVNGENPREAADKKRDQTCALPSKEMTPEEEEAAMIDCLDNAHEKETENTPAPVQSAPQEKRRRTRRGD